MGMLMMVTHSSRGTLVQWKQRIFSQKLELVQELKLLSERVLIAGRKASR